MERIKLSGGGGGCALSRNGRICWREEARTKFHLFLFCYKLSNTMGDYDTVILDIEGTITPITFVKNTLVR